MKTAKKLFIAAMGILLMLMNLSPTVASSIQKINVVKTDSGQPASKGLKTAAPDNRQTDWSAVDWDSEVILLPDNEKYRQDLDKLLKENKNKEAKNLQPVKKSISSDETMNYFNVPADIQEVVKEYRNKKGMFSKENFINNSTAKSLLKDRIKSLLPVDLLTEEPKTDEMDHFIDVTKSPKLQIKKLVPVDGNLKTAPKVTIKSRKMEKPASSLRNVTIEGISEQAKIRGLANKKISILDDGLNKIWHYFSDLFKTQTVNAESPTVLIEYYNGIEKNTLDNALYYLSQIQNEDGSFGRTTIYEETAETALMLSEISRVNNTQFADALNYLKNTAPQNNREKAIKARLMVGLGEPYQTYLDELVANKNDDHGYGLDVGYSSDLQTTMEAVLSMYAANYSIQDELPLALYYVLNHIPSNGALKYSADGPVDYYLINKIAQYLQPFKTMTVGNGQGVSIVAQDKINALLGYLTSQFDAENEKLLGTNNVIDEIMTLKTWEMYNVESINQTILKNKLPGVQYVDGSFGNSVLATAYAIEALKKTDLILKNLQSSGSLVSRQSAVFELSIFNQGYAPSAGGKIYIFADNVDTGLSVDLALNNIVFQPDETITLNITIPESETNSYTGSMDMKFYIEPSEDFNYDDNWIYGTFNFAPAVDGTPALPMYYIATKYEIDGAPNLNIRWQVKSDPLRKNYVAMWREKGTSQWSMYLLSNTWNGAFLGGIFEEGKIYEITAGVLHQDGEAVTYSNDLTDVKMSGEKNLYLGGAAGAVTLDNVSIAEQVSLSGYGIYGKTDTTGNYAQSGLKNGSTAGWVSAYYYEPLVSKFFVSINATTTGIRFFTHLKPDNTPPVADHVEIRHKSDYKVKNQKEVELFAYGSDNVALKEADFYLWEPQEEMWEYLGTQEFVNNSQVLMKWYAPASLLGAGYKIKTVFFDYRGNESQPKEWGPFEIIDGTPPKFAITSPNGGEEWQLGSTHNITWTTEAVNAVPQVSLYALYGDKISYLKSNFDNVGVYSWPIPVDSSYAGTQIKIKVIGSDSVNYEFGMDESDNYFSIADNSPDPQKPWARPILVSLSDQQVLPGCKAENALVDYTEDGTAQIIYHCAQDTYGSERVITEQLYHVVSSDGINFSAPNLIYEKIWQTDANLTGYEPMRDLQFFAKNSEFHILWQSGSSGGCELFNNQEIYHLRYDGNQWSEPENISNNNTESRELNATADNQGNIHAVWLDGGIWDENCKFSGTRKIDYREFGADDSWSNLEELDFDQYPSGPQITVSENGMKHIVYRAGGADSINHVYHSGSWSAPLAIFQESDYTSSYNLRAGTGTNLHFVFNEYYQSQDLNGYRTLYAKFNGNSWETAEEVFPAEQNKSPEYPQLAVDNKDRPQIAVEYNISDPYSRHLLWTTKDGKGSWLSPQAVDIASQFSENNSARLSYNKVKNKVGLVWLAPYAKNYNVYYNQADEFIDENVYYFTGNELQNPWTVYDNIPAGASASIIYEDTTHGNVVELIGTGIDNGYTLNNSNGSLWADATHKYLTWDVKSTGNLIYYIRLNTNQGKRFFTYSTAYKENNISGNIYFNFKLPSELADGSWHTVIRDLEADLKSLEPGNVIKIVDGLSIRGTGRLDNVGLVKNEKLYSIAGQAFDSNNQPITDAEIALSPVGYLIKTDSSGNYSFSSLPPGGYTIKAVKTDYSFTPAQVSLNLVDKNLEQNFIASFNNINYYFTGNEPQNPWTVYDNIPAGASTSIIYENQTHGNVVELIGTGIDNGYTLNNNNGSLWADATHKYLSWDAKSTGNLIYYIRLNTNQGKRFLTYSASYSKENGISGNIYFNFKLPPELADGSWHTVIRDLEADLKSLEPGNAIKTVDGLSVRGTGRLDNVGLVKTIE